MQNFNITRFANTLRWQLSERKHLYRFAAIGFILVFIPTMLGRFIDGTFQSGQYDSGHAETAASFLTFALIAYYITCGALIVDDLGTKRLRINAFMLPASRLEKFGARYLCLTVILPLAFAVGFVAGDLLQMAVSQAVLGNCRSAFYLCFARIFDTLPRLSCDFGDKVTVFVILFWFPHSLYLLAGTFFRRHAWILSNLLLFFLMSVFGGLCAFMAIKIPELLFDHGIYRIGIVDSSLTATAATLVFLLVIAFNYRTAFRIYSRMQAVNNKMFNI